MRAFADDIAVRRKVTDMRIQEIRDRAPKKKWLNQQLDMIVSSLGIERAHTDAGLRMLEHTRQMLEFSKESNETRAMLLERLMPHEFREGEEEPQ